MNATRRHVRDEPHVAEHRAPIEIGAEQHERAEPRVRRMREAEARADRPGGADRDPAERRRQQRLIRRRAADRDERQQQHGRERRLDDVVQAVVVRARRSPLRRIDPDAPVQERIGKQDVIVVRRRLEARSEQDRRRTRAHRRRSGAHTGDATRKLEYWGLSPGSSKDLDVSPSPPRVHNAAPFHVMNGTRLSSVRVVVAEPFAESGLAVLREAGIEIVSLRRQVARSARSRARRRRRPDRALGDARRSRVARGRPEARRRGARGRRRRCDRRRGRDRSGHRRPQHARREHARGDGANVRADALARALHARTRSPRLRAGRWDRKPFIGTELARQDARHRRPRPHRRRRRDARRARSA